MKNIKHIIASVLLIVCFFNNLFSQADFAAIGIGHNRVATYYLGWNNTGGVAGSLDIHSDWANQPIIFWTNNGTIASTLQLVPNFTGADLDITDPYSTYMINGKPVLWHNGITSNIFLGVGAGNGGAGATGTNNTILGGNAGQAFLTGGDNTFCGYRAGQSNTTGANNTFSGSFAGVANSSGTSNAFCGYQSGQSNTLGSLNSFFGRGSGLSNKTGNYNTFIGYNSGLNDTTASQNTFVGSQTGMSNSGTENVFMGESTGLNNTTGYHNTFLGEESGWNNLVGNQNVFVGHLAGYHSTGSKNTFLGMYADATNGTALTNAGAIGYMAKATTDNTLILGNDSVNVGIGLSRAAGGPLAKLEINSNPLGFTWASGNYTTYGSGLKFRQLTNANTPVANAGNMGVLSVDANGDVVYVTDGGTSLGNFCSSPQNPLTADWEIPLSNNNFHFSNTGNIATDLPNVNSVGIGTNCTSSLAASLEIDKSNTNPLEANPTSLFIRQSTDGTSLNAYGINVNLTSSNNNQFNYGEAINVSGATKTNYGLFSQAILPSVGANWAVYGETANGTSGNVAIFGNSHSTTNNNAGVIGVATGSPSANTGGQFSATITGLNNVGVSGTASGATNSNIGVFGSAPVSAINYAGYFQGDVFINGPTFLSTIGYVSDQMFKTNVDTIVNATSIIKQLSPKTYYMDTINGTNLYGMNFSNKKQWGLIAQEVQQVLPELIEEAHKPAVVDSSGNIIKAEVNYKTLNYIEFIPLLMRGIQEQQKIIENLNAIANNQDSVNNALQDQIHQLEQMINACCSNHSMIHNINNNSNSTTTIDVELKDGQNIVLEQNVPNPFAEQTTINYSLPDNTGKAQMLFYNAEGKLIQSVELTNKGKGQLNVFAQDLSNGMYTYTLVVDGKIIATKKMVKQ